MVNIGSLSTGGRVSAVKADLGKIVLTNPVCTEVGEKIALSRRVEKHWRYVCQLSLFISKQYTFCCGIFVLNGVCMYGYKLFLEFSASQGLTQQCI